jgi:hypothetical protein
VIHPANWVHSSCPPHPHPSLLAFISSHSHHHLRSRPHSSPHSLVLCTVDTVFVATTTLVLCTRGSLRTMLSILPSLAPSLKDLIAGCWSWFYSLCVTSSLLSPRFPSLHRIHAFHLLSCHRLISVPLVLTTLFPLQSKDSKPRPSL